MTSNSNAEDWTKFVTLNPPNEVRFKMSEDDKNSDKAFAKITIINKSKSAILFKVSIFISKFNVIFRSKQLILKIIWLDLMLK